MFVKTSNIEVFSPHMNGLDQWFSITIYRHIALKSWPGISIIFLTRAEHIINCSTWTIELWKSMTLLLTLSPFNLHWSTCLVLTSLPVLRLEKVGNPLLKWFISEWKMASVESLEQSITYFQHTYRCWQYSFRQGPSSFCSLRGFVPLFLFRAKFFCGLRIDVLYKLWRLSETNVCFWAM